MQRSNGPSACASCKHQRKKCTNKCVLGPFFPVEKTREFQAVHKVFGVRNVTKMITSVKEEERQVAVDSLVWEALCRQKDPVLGPYGDYRRICEELRLYKSSSSSQLLYQQCPTTHQESIMYKATAATGVVGMGWSNNNNFHGGPAAAHAAAAAAGVVDYCPYGYSSSSHHDHIQDTSSAEKRRLIRGEMENGSAALILPHQQQHKHLATAAGFNQHYIFTAGQYNPMGSKSIESTLWEGSS